MAIKLIAFPFGRVNIFQNLNAEFLCRCCITDITQPFISKSLSIPRHLGYVYNTVVALHCAYVIHTNDSISKLTLFFTLFEFLSQLSSKQHGSEGKHCRNYNDCDRLKCHHVSCRCQLVHFNTCGDETK